MFPIPSIWLVGTMWGGKSEIVGVGVVSLPTIFEWLLLRPKILC